ncbi:MAG TPA: hypothetical protein VF101_07080 [Gaiellaceae bacterium]
MTHAERYLELALRLARHDPDLVDFYYGPPELERRVAEEPLLELSRLVADADELLAELADAWLAGQVRALGATARTLAGEELPYPEEVALKYGIRPQWVDEREFERGHALLDEALPGSGDLAARFVRRLEEVALPGELTGPALREAVGIVRERTRDAVGLPEGEDVELEVVTGELWLGFARYLGGFRTRIGLNADLPFPADDLLWFAAHEAYPGHHSHRAWQEAEVVRGSRRLEPTLGLLRTPDAVITEGIAQAAPPLVLDGAYEELAERLAPLRFDYDSETGARVAAADHLLVPVWSNAAILRHERGASREEAWQYAAQWSLLPRDRVDKFFASQVEDRGALGYVHCYSHGERLCSAYVAGDPGRLRRLVTELVLPSDLVA